MRKTKVTKNLEHQPSEGLIDVDQRNAIAHLREFYPQLGEDLVVDGNLNLANTIIQKLPSGLKVEGSLDLRNTFLLKEWPKRLTVKGNLYLNFSITESPVPNCLNVLGDINAEENILLPDNYAIGGSLHLHKTTRELPANLTINGSLDISGTGITMLPTGLKVLGDLTCSGLPIEELPANLYVGGRLCLSRTKIKKVPSTVYFGGGLSIAGTEVKIFPKHITKVMGSLDISNTAIRYLPSGLFVLGDLWLEESEIIELPDNLTVRGGLYAEGTHVDHLPESLKVARDIYLEHCPIERLPENLVVNGDLDISKTLIEEIPESLTVIGGLYMRETLKIKFPKVLNVGYLSLPDSADLPEGFTLKGNIGIYDRSRKGELRRLPEIMIVSGNMTISNVKLEEMPRGLKIGGDLEIIETDLSSFPEEVEIGGQLIYDCSISSSLLFQLLMGRWQPAFEVVIPKSILEREARLAARLAMNKMDRIRFVGDNLLLSPPTKQESVNSLEQLAEQF